MGKAKRGIWTPWAVITCYPCHGPVFPHRTITDEEMAEEALAYELEEGNSFTVCDNCKELVQLYSPIAREHRLMNLLKRNLINAEMWQTGGMNSAVGIQLTEDTQIVVNYEGKYNVVHYMENDEDHEIYSEDSFDFRFEALEHIKNLLEANSNE